MTTEFNLKHVPRFRTLSRHIVNQTLSHAQWRSVVSLYTGEVLDSIPSGCHSTLPFTLLQWKRLTRSITQAVQAHIRNDLGCQVTCGEAFDFHGGNVDYDHCRGGPLEYGHVRPAVSNCVADEMVIYKYEAKAIRRKLFK